MQKTSGATAKKAARTATATRTARDGKKGARTESPGDIDIAMLIEKAGRRGGETRQGTRGMGMTSEMSSAGTGETTAMLCMMGGTSSEASIGSMARTGGTKEARLSSAGRLCDRRVRGLEPCTT